MQQLDFFNNSKEDFLYGEVEKIRTSMDKRTRSIFALIGELQDQIISIKADAEKCQKKKRK